jgi:hypothetical protein
VSVKALLKRDERSRADMAALQASLNAATAAVDAANANAQAAQAVAAAATAFTFKPATPPRYENKDKRRKNKFLSNFDREGSTVGVYLGHLGFKTWFIGRGYLVPGESRPV